jgi:hypothetical protein
MSDHTEFLPDFLLNVRFDEGNGPYVVSCSIVGQLVGFRGVVRKFANKESLISEFRSIGIPSERYADVVSAVDAEPGQTKSFRIDLNEAQRMSVIQTDSTE